MSELTSFHVIHAYDWANDKGTILTCRGGIFDYHAPKTLKAMKHFIATDYPLTAAERKTFTQEKNTIVLDNIDKSVLDKILATYNTMRLYQGSAEVCFERERTKFTKIAFVSKSYSD